MNVPFFDAKKQYKKIKPQILKAVQSVLASGKFVLGEQGKIFERALADYIGVKYGIGVNSGTDAIKIALRACDIGPGDEVITVSNTAVPTVSAIRETGATPVFVDIDEFYTIDASKIEQKITRKTKAIIPVHLYGQPCDMPAIAKIAKRHKLKVIEDCAQATGAMLGKKRVGSFGDVSCFSFYPTKNLGAYGDGGMILTSNRKLADACRALRMYGMEKGYYAEREGFNSRLDEVQAAILKTKLSHVDQWNAARGKIANYYRRHMTNPHISLPRVRPGVKHVFHLFVIQTPYREQLIKHLASHGIGYGIHYPTPIHLQRAYKFLNVKKGSLPRTEKSAPMILSLPIFPELTKKEIKNIVQAINAFSL